MLYLFHKIHEEDGYMRTAKDNIFLIANILLPILLGGIFYYLAAPEVLFVKYMDHSLGRGIHFSGSWMGHEIYIWLRCYLMDMLWGYALVFSLVWLGWGTSCNNLQKMLLLVVIFSAGMECLQLLQYVAGTFDPWDIVVEALAEGLAVFLMHQHFRGGHKG